MSKSKTKKKKKQDHRDDTIVITVNGDNLDFTYDTDGSPANRHATDRNHYVRWRCDDGNYTIVFGEHTPFANPSYSKKRSQPLNIPVRHETDALGTFKYTVVVEPRDNKHVITDPQVVIN